ncbi:MAG: DUF2087 domain-containing protein [Oscillospiraceae bacterium]|jgi:hypothetical protein|nr:DUF2087 domain-containing protein [Oscillospiraceae bacterium]
MERSVGVTGNPLPPFLDADGRLKQYPSKRSKQLAALGYLAAQIAPERVYTEREINELLDNLHTFGDCALLRRELCDAGFLTRKPDGSEYRCAALRV